MSRGHVLVVRPDNHGDVLLAGPAIRAVAEHADEVTLWVGPRGRAAADLLPGVDRVLCRSLPWIDLAPEPVDSSWLAGLVDELAELEIDAAVVLGSFHQSPLPTALVLRAAGIGFVGATSVDYPGSLLDVRHRIDDDVHEVERSLSLVRDCGFELPPGDDGRLRLRPLDARVDVPAPYVPAPYVVVHPGTTAPARAWEPDRYARVVDGLHDAGWRVVVTGGPGDLELTAHVAGRRRPGVHDLGGATDWPTLAGVIGRAAVLVVGNTGPAHLAAAVDTPVVELFAPVVPAARWRPWKVAHELLGDQEIGCAGCRAIVCPFTDHPCLAVVTPADVVSAVDRLAVRDGGVPRPALGTGARR